MFLYTVVCFAWTAFLTALLLLVHLLTLGLWDATMLVGRYLWTPPLLKLGGVDLIHDGGKNLSPDQPYVAVGNHQGVLDILGMYVALQRQPIRFIAKEILFYVPIFGWYLWLAGYVSVDRGSRAKAFKSLDRAAERIHSSKSTIVVFPEGSRSPDGQVKRFKKGAFVLALRAQVPVVPVAIQGSYEAFNKSDWRINPGSTIRMRVLEPIPTEGMTMDDRDKLSTLARDAIVAGVEQLSHEAALAGSQAADDAGAHSSSP